MICEEVMEYMQRYLDRDLHDIEIKKLQEHIRSCPECAEMFERLKKMSGELEALPKVDPPYSLVDAILPRIAEMERLHGTHSAGTSDSGHSRPESKPQSNRWFSKLPGRWPMRTMGGVIAAGIVLGLFIANGNFGILNNTDKNPEQLGYGIMTERGAADSGEFAPMGIMEFSSGGNEEGAPDMEINRQFTVTEQYGEEKSYPQAGPSYTPEQAPSPMPAEGGGGLSESEFRGSPPAAPDAIPSVNPDSQLSPDGSMAARMENNQLVISDRSGETLYRSSRVWKDSEPLHTLVWSEDGSRITYAVQTESGPRTFMIDLKSLEEREG